MIICRIDLPQRHDDYAPIPFFQLAVLNLGRDVKGPTIFDFDDRVESVSILMRLVINNYHQKYPWPPQPIVGVILIFKFHTITDPWCGIRMPCLWTYFITIQNVDITLILVSFVVI